MSSRVFFEQFEGAIRELFGAAIAEAGDGAQRLSLELNEEPYQAKEWCAEKGFYVVCRPVCTELAKFFGFPTVDLAGQPGRNRID